MTKLCPSCSVKRDYRQGWVYCPHRRVWLDKGYAHCKGFRARDKKKGEMKNEG